MVHYLAMEITPSCLLICQAVDHKPHTYVLTSYVRYTWIEGGQSQKACNSSNNSSNANGRNHDFRFILGKWSMGNTSYYCTRRAFSMNFSRPLRPVIRVDDAVERVDAFPRWFRCNYLLAHTQPPRKVFSLSSAIVSYSLAPSFPFSSSSFCRHYHRHAVFLMQWIPTFCQFHLNLAHVWTPSTRGFQKS
jgi:hypothetical protein